MPWEILIAEEYSLAEATQISCSIPDCRMKVFTKVGTVYSFRSVEGEAILSGMVGSDGFFEIDYSILTGGEYQLILQKGTESKWLQIVL